MLTKETYRLYVRILKEELVPAMGCTEPISIAYAAASDARMNGCDARCNQFGQRKPRHYRIRTRYRICKGYALFQGKTLSRTVRV